MINVQQALVNIENDHRAARTNLSLNYGNLKGVENSPTATWNGNITNRDMTDNGNCVAIWDATFTRQDGKNTAPICELGFDYIMAGQVNATVDEMIWRMWLLEVGSNYIKFRIALMGGAQGFYNGWEDVTNMSVVVQAISPVKGSLSIARVYV